MKQLFILLAMCEVMTAHAADYDKFTAKNPEGIEMNFLVLSEADKTCQVGYYGECCIPDNTIEGTLTIPETANGYRVTEIGFKAFAGCKNISSFNLPASIVVINEQSFANCTALEELTLPKNLTRIRSGAFFESGLKSIKWNDAIRVLESDVFHSCAFTEITIPGCITFQGSAILCNCQDLTTVTLEEGITMVPDMFFQVCKKLTTVNLPKTITYIGKRAFAYTELLTEFVISEGCTEMGMNVFEKSNVKKVWIPTTLQKTNQSFESSIIEEFVIAEGLTSIKGLFQNVKTLKRVHLPASVTDVTRAFDGCPAIEQFTVDPNNKVFDARDNCNGIIETATNTLVLGCATTTIPASVTAIGQSAFNGVQGITDFVVPEQIKSIGALAFYNSSLTSITFPDGLENLGTNALGCTNITEYVQPKNINIVPQSIVGSCEKLTTVTLHDKTETIREGAFYGTKSLKTLTLPTSVKTIGKRVFVESGLEYLTVPSTVNEIGEQCFTDCRKIKHLIIEGSPNLIIRTKAFYNTTIDHLSFLTSSLSLNGCGLQAFYPNKVTYQAYYDERIRNSFSLYSRVLDPFIGIMAGDEWTPFICPNKNFELPDGLEAYVIVGLQNGKAQLQQVQSLNKGQAVLLKLKDATKASQVFNMASGDMLRFDTKELDDSEITAYKGFGGYHTTVEYMHLYEYDEYKGKSYFFFENGSFVKYEEDEVYGLKAFFAFTPGTFGDLSTIAIGEVVPDVKGDADGNGKVEPADVAAIRKYILMGAYSPLADVNKDSKVDVADIVELVNLLRGQ